MGSCFTILFKWYLPYTDHTRGIPWNTLCMCVCACHFSMTLNHFVILFSLFYLTFMLYRKWRFALPPDPSVFVSTMCCTKFLPFQTQNDIYLCKLMQKRQFVVMKRLRLGLHFKCNVKLMVFIKTFDRANKHQHNSLQGSMRGIRGLICFAFLAAQCPLSVQSHK